MNAKALVLAACACCVLEFVGCASPTGQKQDWNFFSDWKIDLRTKKDGKAAEQPAVAQKQPQGATLLLATASDLEGEGHLREAAVLVEKARQMTPHAPELSQRLASLYERLHDVPQARAEYRQALAAAPQNADLWNSYGYFEFREAQFAAAEQAFRKALAISPQHALAHLNLAQTLANAGRLNEAYAEFAGIQGEAAAHASIGAILAGKGQLDAARGAYAQALALNPQDAAALAFMQQTAGPAVGVLPAAAAFPVSGPAPQFAR